MLGVRIDRHIFSLSLGQEFIKFAVSIAISMRDSYRSGAGSGAGTDFSKAGIAHA
jgi:hypothetical protein